MERVVQIIDQAVNNWRTLQCRAGSSWWLSGVQGAPLESLLVLKVFIVELSEVSIS